MSDGIVFQQIDIEHYQGRPHEKLIFSSNKLSKSELPIMKIFGVTPDQNSIMCHVHGFKPYFYIPCPAGMNEFDIPEFLDFFNKKNIALEAEIVKKTSIYGYSKETGQNFIKIKATSPSDLNIIKNSAESGFKFGRFQSQSYATFESNMPIVLRFMVDAKITGMNWIEISPSRYSIRCHESKISNCQIEIDIM